MFVKKIEQQEHKDRTGGGQNLGGIYGPHSGGGERERTDEGNIGEVVLQDPTNREREKP